VVLEALAVPFAGDGVARNVGVLGVQWRHVVGVGVRDGVGEVGAGGGFEPEGAVAEVDDPKRAVVVGDVVSLA
jgi:hypothetical protein